MPETLGITQKTAWHMMHPVREASQDPEPILLDGAVEKDKTYIGGLEANKHWGKKLQAEQGTAHKPPDSRAPSSTAAG